MKITPCRQYHAVIAGQSTLRMPDKKSIFKVYYLSLLGREDPARVDWQNSPFTIKEFESAFLQGKHEGVGFITAFPHIAKIFRFSPYVETILDVRGYYPDGMRDWNGTREDGSQEFGCLAEVVIAAGEYQAWANSASVEEYLTYHYDNKDFPLIQHTKLAEYWE